MVGQQTLGGVALFVAVAKAGSFTAGGDMLGISKSAAGKGVTRLEERLGTKLFHRSTRRLSLTADGEAYLAICSSALDAISEVEDTIGGRDGEPVGRVRIDLPAAFGRRVVVPILTGIMQRNAGLHFELSFTDRLIDPVEEGIDLVLRFGETRDQAGLIAYKLTEQRLLVCGSPDYIARRGRPEGVDDLRDHDCIVGSRRGSPLQWTFADGGGPFRIAPPAVHQIGDGDAIIAMTLAGLGLSQMPASLVRHHVASGDLVTALDSCEPPPIPLYALWPGSRHLSPRLRFIVDALTVAAKTGRLD